MGVSHSNSNPRCLVLGDPISADAVERLEVVVSGSAAFGRPTWIAIVLETHEEREQHLVRFGSGEGQTRPSNQLSVAQTVLYSLCSDTSARPNVGSKAGLCVGEANQNARVTPISVAVREYW
jgi:hypothetical protein